MRHTSKSLRVLAEGLALLALIVFFCGRSSAADWKVEVVDQAGAGRFTSMKIDNKGNVHVAYIPDEDTHPLKYAFWDRALDRWFTMKLADYASFCTLAVDSHQNPHISYADHGTGKGAKLRYIHWKGGTQWVKEVLSPPTDAVVGYYTSVALDAHDNPTFSYYDYEGPNGIGFVLRLRSVFWNGKYWELHMVDRQPGSGKFNSMAVDSTGKPHIAYANVKSEYMGLRYASWNGNDWTSETLEGAKEPVGIWSVALAMDEKDTPHIAYTDVSHRLVKYATRKNGQWQLEVVGGIRVPGLPDRNGIALDDQGNPYISYYDAGEGVLRVATRRNGSWYAEALTNDFSGFTSSVQIRDGMLWVAFADDAGRALKVARRPLDQTPPAVSGPPVPLPPAAITKSSAK
jgi:hypothetical protein